VWLVRNLIGAAESAQSQDCLYLNVWTPAADARLRPVLVWIHGGAFVLGSGSAALYDGSLLARRGDVVVVTINYRLGAFGFLDLSRVIPGEGLSNAGLRDQVAALEWVRDNIEAFGGDPENVTIFGESAGGMSVGTLLGTPSAKGLFHRAICQSGAAHNVSPPEKALHVTETFLEALGETDLAALERAPTSRILAAQRRTATKLGFEHGVLPWQPSVDGEVLPMSALDAVGRGVARDVPLLVGTNRHEWRLFMLGDRKGRRLDEEGLRRRFRRALPGTGEGGAPLADLAFEAYAAMDVGKAHDPGRRWEAFQSDRIFHHPAHRLAAVQSGQSRKTFAYQFAWSPPGPARRLGACHGIEIPFVFGTLSDPVLRTLIPFARRARSLSEQMQRAWLEFARTGEPGHPGLPDWAPYEGGRAATMRLAPNCRVEDAPFSQGASFWSQLERGATLYPGGMSMGGSS
jgi:para-nitrobenzyl esterase